MTLVLELPREVEEKLEAMARSRGTTAEAVAIELLARRGAEAGGATRPKKLKGWGAYPNSGACSENITRDRREEVAREEGEEVA